jgi:hypothetical protein
MNPKLLIRDALGALPWTAELDWQLLHRDHKINSRFNLKSLRECLPDATAQVMPFIKPVPQAKNIFLFASSHSWIIHTVLCGLTLRGLGNNVTLGFVPYGDYNKPVNRLDLRLQELYARQVLRGAEPLLEIVPFLELKPEKQLPEALSRAVEKVTVFDVQYMLQREDVTGNEPIYFLRKQRNKDAARRALAYFKQHRPDVVIVPNGMIQEYGAVYEAARFLDIPTTTYEFSELDQHVWLDHNQLVMLHQTDEMWAGCQHRILNDEQRTWLESFLAGREGSKKGNQFAHLWQKTARAGGEIIRSTFGFDQRPIVLLPTNVLGDSATLGRTLFSKSMADWMDHTIRFFADRSEVQLVIRIHPAETWTKGPSVMEIIRIALPELPSHIRVIGATEKVNTYDLMDIADLALVYTTTAGLEMATRGIPVLVSGLAQYRKKGFTLDADSWEEYFSVLDQALKKLPGGRLTPEQIERAWNYTYFYFREYPRPFPWHLEKVMADLRERSIAYVLSAEGRSKFEATFQQLAGSEIK